MEKYRVLVNDRVVAEFEQRKLGAAKIIAQTHADVLGVADLQQLQGDDWVYVHTATEWLEGEEEPRPEADYREVKEHRKPKSALPE